MYAICIWDDDTKEITHLYDYIETWEKVDLLAQLAMCQKRDNDLIVVMPGWNRGINRDPELYNRALELADEYCVENQY